MKIAKIIDRFIIFEDGYKIEFESKYLARIVFRERNLKFSDEV